MLRHLSSALFIFTVLAMVASCGRGKPKSAWSNAGYHVRDNVVYFLANWTSEAFEVPGADAATFKFPLTGSSDTGHASDKNAVYYRGEVIDGADPATFEFVHGRYWRDKNSVFVTNTRVSDDPKNLVVMTDYMFKTSKAVYRLGSPQLEVLSNDPANFKQVGPDHSFYYFTADTEKVFINGVVLPGADPKTFEVLKDAYTRDAQQCFYFDKAMPPGTLKDSLEPLAGGYAKDRKRVYYLGKVLQGADAASFVVTDPNWPKAQDRNSLYDQGSRKPLISPH